jgi:ABC-type multidrug transport system fused ATPase/permease subunit
MGTGTNLFAILDRKTPLPGMGSDDVVKGPFSSAIWDIRLHNVHFSYDSRKDHIILNGLNLDIPKGRTMALVGM